MDQRRLAGIATSDNEDNSTPPMSPNKEEERRQMSTRKKWKLIDEDEEEEEQERGMKKKPEEEDDEEEEEEEEPTKRSDEEEEPPEDATPIGDVIKVVGRGRGRREHYAAFEYYGLRYELEDPVLLVPAETTQKPYVAIIKEITQTKEGGVMVNGQWFYRPEEAKKKGGGNWQSRDARELFYSFHRDEVPAESVMHKCVVHFIPLHKQIPHRKQHPGFFVQKVYDTGLRRLFNLTGNYEDSKQDQLDILVEKTLSRLGDIPDIDETEGTSADQEDGSSDKRNLRKKKISHCKSGQKQPYGETPRSVPSNASEFYLILSNFEALTGETQRDKWLEKLLQGIQFKEKSVAHGSGQAGDSSSKTNGTKLVWPDSAVRAVSALEKAAYESLPDFGKYNQKMRQLVFNLKSNESLSRRLLNEELEPATILNMSPSELRVGLTAEEIAVNEPERPEAMQMTGARCRICLEQNVGIADIIQASRGDRYQLLCISCGNTWYAFRDEASISTVDASETKKPLREPKAEEEDAAGEAQHKDKEAAGEVKQE